MTEAALEVRMMTPIGAVSYSTPPGPLQLKAAQIVLAENPSALNRQISEVGLVVSEDWAVYESIMKDQTRASGSSAPPSSSSHFTPSHLTGTTYRYIPLYRTPASN
ncbi:unnamed protein product [Leuciscus chuanchicus]